MFALRPVAYILQNAAVIIGKITKENRDYPPASSGTGGAMFIFAGRGTSFSEHAYKGLWACPSVPHQHTIACCWDTYIKNVMKYFLQLTISLKLKYKSTTHRIKKQIFLQTLNLLL